MRSFSALIRKDLKGYLDQPTGYILLVIFLAITSYMFFRTAMITSEASLRPLFDVLPWLLAIFVPAATMRLVAEEQRDGTLEILLTQPLRVWSVLSAKFLAGLAFVGIGILLTVGIPLAVMTTGDLDGGAVIAQYIGTFFFTAALVAIGLFSSSLTRNQIVAFMAALTITMVLMVAGLPFVSLALPQNVAVPLQGISPLVHYSGIARGVLDLRDVLYFVAIISTFLSATYLLIRGKSVSHRSMLYRNLQAGVASLIVLSLLIGWFGSSIRGRWDLTENRLYTLSPATKELLSGLDDIVTIKFFASKNPPPQASLVVRDIADFLNDVALASNGNVKVVRKYPDENEEAAEEASRKFIPAVQFSEQTGGELSVQLGWLGLGMNYANRYEAIPFVETVDGLEYQVASGIYRMVQKEPTTVAFMTGYGAKRRDYELQSLRNQLEQHYEVSLLEAAETGSFSAELPTIDVLIVAGPTEYVPLNIQEVLDDYLAEGGNALIMLDPVRVDESRLVAERNEFSMAEWLHDYGLIMRDNVVFDLRSNKTVTFQSQFGTVSLQYPFWATVPVVEKKISGGIVSAAMPWVSSVDIAEPTEKTLDIEVTPLLVTTEFGGLDTEYKNISVQSPALQDVPQEDLGERGVAVAAGGTRCPTLQPKCEKDPEKRFRMIVISDSDWVSESKVRQFPEHLTLGVNFVDWLAQDDALAEIRSKGSSLRHMIFESETHRNLVQYCNIIGVPVIIVLAGIIRYLMRRSMMRKEYGLEG